MPFSARAAPAPCRGIARGRHRWFRERRPEGSFQHPAKRWIRPARGDSGLRDPASSVSVACSQQRSGAPTPACAPAASGYRRTRPMDCRTRWRAHSDEASSRRRRAPARASLDDMTRPIYVQITGLIRGNVTPQQLLLSLQEQSDQNNAYILLIDGSGNIVRQLEPQQNEPLAPIVVAPNMLPQGITSAVQGKIRSSDGRVFLYSAYPLTKQTGQLNKVEALVLATIRPGTFSVLGTFILPLVIAAGIALIISLLIAILLARSIYKPLASMTKAALEISKGKYDHRIDPKGPKEIKELAESINHMTEDVGQAQLRLRHFVADVSHELRSPLTSIQGFAQALIDGTASDEATKLKAAQIINEESVRLKRQVDELLELSRMQSNQINITKEQVEIGEILEHCVEVFSVQAKQKGMVLEIKSAPKLYVVGDADRLEQIFNNLLDNAIKNTPSGGKVSLTGETTGSYAQIVVSDNGPGIPPDQLPFVFERFYQVTGSRTGVGLGLAIAREIVTAHGGTIHASSEPGQGARFTINLPLWVA